MARTVLLGPERVRRTVTRLAYEVVERNRGADNLVVFGLRRRGVALAHQLAEILSDVAGHTVPVHALDVSAFRDDRAGDAEATLLSNDAPDATDRDVLIVDDVLFTGRTARASLDAVLQHGRPRTIQLAVLIDRGHREVPVHPDYVGRIIPTKAAERVTVDPEVPSVYLDD
ncbi:MAG: bifunctional pyr operon transcriptional regulator/uracil phosphoribosyltransferase PyrR [Rubricoccaceae bacterium]